jgi:hypothetical protein
MKNLCLSLALKGNNNTCMRENQKNIEQPQIYLFLLINYYVSHYIS